jgi:membrane-associated protease RseP (regulator of RpoE activity)
MTSWNYQPPPPPGVPKTIFDDIEQIKGVVAKYFPIYNTQVHFDMVSMSCNVDQNNLEQNFESLRKELKTISYIPLITKERGEHIVHVVKSPPAKFRGPWLNLVLLIATIGTTIWAGATLWASVFNTGSFMETENLANGALYFALPLMLILSIHEMGHYFAARKHGVAASLPFFIPVPFTILGTMGAFISIREPIPNKKALMDIGFAGPIAGFIVAIPVLCIGLILSGDMTVPAQTGTLQGGTMLIGTSVLFETFTTVFGLGAGASIHPLAFAGWVGFFVTALNLLPVGQLDGGHIARALLGEKSRWAGYAAIGAMLVLGLFSTQWLFFALLIMFMGMKHPPPLNEVTNLDNRRKAVGIAAALMLVLCFVPVPLDQVQVNYNYTYQEADATPVGVYYSHSIDKSVSSDWQNTTVPFRIVNNGNMPLELKFNITTSSNTSEPQNYTAWLSRTGDVNATIGRYFNVTLDIDESLNLTLNMIFSPVQNSTSVTIDVAEIGYDWESSRLYTDSHEQHGMRVKVNFN